MVKAELEYNPYLLETIIKFNGQKPRINSLVEKYESGALREWIDKVPKIFYDEMNGYDFELEFTGTEREFIELKEVFRKKGVTEDQVRIFHKSTIASRKEKTQKLEELLQWLSNNRNAHFDYDQFEHDNKELFEGMYPFIVMNGYGLDISAFDNSDVSVEQIEDVKELEHTALKDTPIILYISSRNSSQLSEIVSELFEREDVTVNQLFFMVDNRLNSAQVERILIDIGITSPQIVSQIDDEKVLRYLELYPYSDYIHDALCIFRSEVDSLSESLEEEKRIKLDANREVYEKLKELEIVIDKLKRTQEHFEDDNNSEIPQLWEDNVDDLLKLIKQWKIRKTILKKYDEAERLVAEYVADVQSGYSKYLQTIDCLYDQKIEELCEEYDSWYAEAEYKDDYKPDVEELEKPKVDELPAFAEELLDMKQEQYVDAKEGILGKFFKESTDEPREKVLETTFYLQNWRDYIYELVEPLARNVMDDYFSNKCEVEKRILASYTSHLSDEITKKNEEINNVSSQLSDEEKRLQSDSDWLRNFEDILRNIERC